MRHSYSFLWPYLYTVYSVPLKWGSSYTNTYCAHTIDKHACARNNTLTDLIVTTSICVQEATALIHHISKNLPPNTPLLNNSNGGLGGTSSQEGHNSAEGWLENLLLRSQGDINGMGRF